MTLRGPYSTTAPLPGTVVGEKYRIDREIGGGGMGRVMAGHNLLLDLPVAVKFLTHLESRTARERFLGEARAAQTLGSEHVVRVFDVGLFGDQPYIVMELLDGQDLGSLVEQRGALPVTEAVDYILEACLALADAHAAGIVHRDVKPSNLFLTHTAAGRPLVKVVDFGISKMLARGSQSGETTRSDALLGSPYYMSPEQLRDPSRVDVRSDIWSLAVTLYHLVTAAHPFEGDTVSAISAAIFTDPPHPVTHWRADVPAGLITVIERALDKDREQRPSSVRALAEQLAPFGSARGRLCAERLAAGDRRPTSRPPPPPRVEAALASTETGGAVGLGAPEQPDTHAPASVTGSEPGGTARSRRRALYFVVACAAGAVALVGWFRRPQTRVTDDSAGRAPTASGLEPVASAGPVESSSPPGAPPSASTTATPGAPPSASTTAAPVASAAPREKPASASRRPPANPQPSRRARPSASVAPSGPRPAASSRGPVDVDGIPIIE